MPSLNLSLPGLPVMPAGPFPVAASPIAPIAMPGDGFAAMLEGMVPAPPIDGVPVLKPMIGTPLPPERQEFAGDMPPILAGDPEDVVAALPPAPLAEQPTVGIPVAKATEESVTETLPDPVAPAPDVKPVVSPPPRWDAHGASRLVLAQVLPQVPAPAPRVALPFPNEPLIEVVEDEINEETEVPAPETAVAAPLPPAARPAPATIPVPPVPALVTEAERPAPPAPGQPTDRPEPALRQPLAHFVPAQIPAAAPAAAANAAPSPATPVPPAPAPQPAVTAQPPHNFTLPPEIAREIAQLVRPPATGTDTDAPELLPADSESRPAPSVQATPQPAAPLHRDFAVVHRPAIDTSRAEWMQAMIERIAEMPQADGRREAQIRLLPDALGAIEVKIVERQERLHVTLNADSAQARQLLTDAAPRLHELAEARGLRLGQTGIGGGESQDRRPATEQQPQAAPLRPRSATADATPQTDSPGDLIA